MKTQNNVSLEDLKNLALTSQEITQIKGGERGNAVIIVDWGEN